MSPPALDLFAESSNTLAYLSHLPNPHAMRRFRRLLDDLRQARHVVHGREIRIAVGLVLLLVAFVGADSVVWLDVVVTLVLDGVFSPLGTVIALFGSLAIHLKATRRSEHGRPTSPTCTRNSTSFGRTRVERGRRALPTDGPGRRRVRSRQPALRL